jgi:hypothetical protein
MAELKNGIINLTCGSEKQAQVRSDLDLTEKKKPWDKGFAGNEEFEQKGIYQQSLGDSGTAISNKGDD